MYFPNFNQSTYYVNYAFSVHNDLYCHTACYHFSKSLIK